MSLIIGLQTRLVYPIGRMRHLRHKPLPHHGIDRRSFGVQPPAPEEATQPFDVMLDQPGTLEYSSQLG